MRMKQMIFSIKILDIGEDLQILWPANISCIQTEYMKYNLSFYFYHCFTV